MHLTDLARVHGDKPAVIMAGSGAVLSYAELDRQSNKIAQLFRARGLRPGDHIAVLMENRPEFFPVVWAAQRSGLFYTPVNWHLPGGVNVYPREIADALALHPAVADIVVFGIPDEEMGQRVHAVVQPAVPGTGTPELGEELIAFCRVRIAHYKAPRSVSFEDELPRLPTGKMLRRLLMDRYRSLPSSQ